MSNVIKFPDTWGKQRRRQLRAVQQQPVPVMFTDTADETLRKCGCKDCMELLAMGGEMPDGAA